MPPSTVGWVERSETQHKISATLKKKKQTIRQRRFWEHFIRNDLDLIRHVEYIRHNSGVLLGFVTLNPTYGLNAYA